MVFIMCEYKLSYTPPIFAEFIRTATTSLPLPSTITLVVIACTYIYSNIGWLTDWRLSTWNNCQNLKKLRNLILVSICSGILLLLYTFYVQYLFIFVPSFPYSPLPTTVGFLLTSQETQQNPELSKTICWWRMCEKYLMSWPCSYNWLWRRRRRRQQQRHVFRGDLLKTFQYYVSVKQARKCSVMQNLQNMIT